MVYIKILFVLFIVYNIFHAQQQHLKRYNGWRNDFPNIQDTYDITPYMRELGIKADDKVIVFYDICQSSLYLMNQKGWYYTKDKGDYTIEDQVADSVILKKYIDNGAKYLIVNDINELIKRKAFYRNTFSLKGNYNNTFIFDLTDTVRNFILYTSPKEESICYCDFENATDTLQETVYCDSDIKMHVKNYLTTEFARSGNVATILEKDNKYGASIRIKVEPNDQIKVSAFSYPQDSNFKIVISSKGKSKFRYDNTTFKQYDKIWDLATMKSTIPNNFEEDSVTIYFWNTGNDDNIIIDDVEIYKLKSFEIINLN